MKKSYKKKTKKIYDILQKNRSKIKKRSIILALFFLGVNIFAWFIYITQVDVNLDADVVAWDVNFFDGPQQVKEINIVETLYPGMDTYVKEIDVNNNSETEANFEYIVKSFSIMGIDSMIEDGTNEEQVNSLLNDYPFVIRLEADKDKLGQDDNLKFVLTIDWSYEQVGEFHRLTKHFTFDPSVVYYQLSEGEYYPYDISSNSFEQHKLDLYVEKDDADSFFGEACAEYQGRTGRRCLNLKLLLKVTQVE